MARVLVTGASGFVGRAAVKALRARGHEVHGVARHPSVDVELDVWHETDLLNASATEELVRTVAPTHLLHLAWVTEHGRFWSDPANGTWEQATALLVGGFAGAGGIRFVLAGSCAQYDWVTTRPLREDAVGRNPATLYGQSKQAASDRIAEESGVSSATGLLFFPYGPYDNPDRLVPSVTHSLLAGESAEVRSGGEIRDFVHVDDCGAALAALLDSDVTGPVNVGTGTGTTIAGVARTVGRLLDCEELVRVASNEPGTSVVADITRLRDETGFVARHDLESGLADTVRRLANAPEVSAG
jgi:nucleoside-diphosphate-sugar epimerase